jgi:hypothetical protein
MVAGAAVGAAEAADNPLDELVLVNRKLDHVIELSATLGKQKIKSFGLGASAGKAIENGSLLGCSVEPLANQRTDDRIAHQLAALHDCLGLEADRSASRHRFPKHVSSREVDHSALRLEPSGLRAFASPWRAQKNDVQQHCGALPLPAEQTSAAAAWS